MQCPDLAEFQNLEGGMQEIVSTKKLEIDTPRTMKITEYTSHSMKRRVSSRR